MKKECNIVQDLLPNYIENLVSTDTQKYIENHINECNECRKTLELMKSDKTDNKNKEEKIELDHLKKYRKKMIVIKIVAIILGIIAIIAVIIGIKFAINYNRYDFITKNVLNSRQEMEKMNNYSVYELWGYENKETGEIKIKAIHEYYYKDGKYKEVDKIISKDNLNVTEALSSLDGVITNSIEYGNINSDEKVRILPRTKTIEKINKSYEEHHYIRHSIYSYALKEIIGADEREWKTNFAINISNNSIRQDTFLGMDCYIVREEHENQYEEIWYNKGNYRPVRIINNELGEDEFTETIILYNEGDVTETDVEFNQEQYKDYTIKK